MYVRVIKKSGSCEDAEAVVFVGHVAVVVVIVW